ncbi:hypothetical protein EVJ58_g4877 [Rhodofomes roseus]|uniref:Uncharacterized protein n=1 Tax=Rhodofomes roseus TaxID=34475 RepID=A0A4Y9YGZ0_9APHY|nr:hypothetical protein EVJ58_g4877 [Rhodofomes roseus]
MQAAGLNDVLVPAFGSRMKERQSGEKRILQLAGRVHAVLQASVTDQNDAKAALHDEIVELNLPPLLASAIEQVSHYGQDFQLSAIQEDDPLCGITVPMCHIKQHVDCPKQAAGEKNWWKQAEESTAAIPAWTAGKKRDALTSNAYQPGPAESASKAGKKRARAAEDDKDTRQPGATKRPRQAKEKLKSNYMETSDEDEHPLAAAKSKGNKPRADGVDDGGDGYVDDDNGVNVNGMQLLPMLNELGATMSGPQPEPGKVTANQPNGVRPVTAVADSRQPPTTATGGPATLKVAPRLASVAPLVAPLPVVSLPGLELEQLRLQIQSAQLHAPCVAQFVGIVSGLLAMLQQQDSRQAVFERHLATHGLRGTTAADLEDRLATTEATLKATQHKLEEMQADLIKLDDSLYITCKELDEWDDSE